MLDLLIYCIMVKIGGRESKGRFDFQLSKCMSRWPRLDCTFGFYYGRQ